MHFCSFLFFLFISFSENSVSADKESPGQIENSESCLLGKAVLKPISILEPYFKKPKSLNCFASQGKEYLDFNRGFTGEVNVLALQEKKINKPAYESLSKLAKTINEFIAKITILLMKGALRQEHALFINLLRGRTEKADSEFEAALIKYEQKSPNNYKKFNKKVQAACNKAERKNENIVGNLIKCLETE